MLLATRLVGAPGHVGFRSDWYPLVQASWLRDTSWIDSTGQRQLEQQIFDAVLARVEAARSLILVDMFLFNDWQGPTPEPHRALADELTRALERRLGENSPPAVFVITDPINTVYGGQRSRYLDRLREAGAEVVQTELVRLQDSNPLYSGLWRWLLRPFGNDPSGAWLPNPLGAGDVTARSWLALPNFKANHRKLLVTDSAAGQWQAIVSSANPHDGSSAHRNTALAFGGEAALALLERERALLLANGSQAVAERLDRILASLTPSSEAPVGSNLDSSDTDSATVQILTESAIRDVVVEVIDAARSGERVNLSMFYLAHRSVVAALKRAARRGVRVRALLDVNRDAFGRAKNGVPNRPVAAELVDAGVMVRWCETRGEQCHEKTLHHIGRETQALVTGSGNFTRRNLDDFNLETDVAVRAPIGHGLLLGIGQEFEEHWNNRDDRTYSSDYARYADDSPWLTIQYRLMEASGISTF